jgi:hypothetical protein
MRITPIFLAASAAVFLHCATLHEIAVDTCGNGVVDADEDCEPYQATCSPACRLQCDASSSCPVGWGCGTDNICRQMKGTFDGAKAAVSTNIVTLVAGDFDGDHRTDIIGSPPFGSAGGSRVHYFDGDGNLGATTLLDLAIPLAIARDLDKDGRDDIGFSYRDQRFGAFGVLAGRSDRTFSTLVFPSVTVPGLAQYNVITRGPNTHLPDDIGSCAIGVGSDNFLHNLCGASLAGGIYNLKVDFGAADVLGNPAVGVIHESALDADRACGEIVFVTAKIVHIASPCQLNPSGGISWSSGPNATPLEVPLPVGFSVVGNPYIGPVEGLDRDNLLIGGMQNNLPSFLIYRKGLTPDKPGTFDMLAPAFHNDEHNQLPLASADFDGDGTVDFVFPNGITMNRPVGDAGKDFVKKIYPPRDSLTWSNARVGFFNDDALPDVLVSFDNSLDVDVLGNASEGRFTSFTVRSDKVVRAVMSGDFDGDRIQDVAYVQADDDLTKLGTSELVYAFGNANGTPDAPRVVGKFKAAVGLGALRDANTGVDSMAVVESLIDPTNAANNQTAVSVVYGSGARQQIAPLFMLDTKSLGAAAAEGAGAAAIGPQAFNQQERFWQPISFNVGSFTTKGTQEIMSISTGILYAPGSQDPIDLKHSPTGVWLASADPSAVGGLDPFKEVQDLIQVAGVDRDNNANGGFNVRTIVATGDLDPATGTGTDEAVSVSQLDVGQANVVVIHLAANGPPTPDGINSIPNAEVSGGDPIRLVDLDGDNVLDVVFVTKIGGKRTLNVIRGDGKGSLRKQELITLKLPVRDGSADADILGFAPIVTGRLNSAVDRVELAVITASSLTLAKLRLNGGGFDTTDLTNHISGSPNLTGVASGDVNGDGVPDLAVADGGAIRVILQQPVHK